MGNFINELKQSCDFIDGSKQLDEQLKFLKKIERKIGITEERIIHMMKEKELNEQQID